VNGDVAAEIWMNGRFLSTAQATLSLYDRGLLYGDGVFETLRAQDGQPLFLQDHLTRLKHSLAALRIPWPQDMVWREVLVELLRRNRLDSGAAAVKILVTRGATEGLGLPRPQQPTLLLTARPYTPPTASEYAAGWRLHIMTAGYAPPLARHKTLNYLYFLVARQSALDAGADDAVIVDPLGLVTETAAGSLLARTCGRWWRPASSYQLTGTTVARVSELLREVGHEVSVRAGTVADLQQAETVWVTNSLIGIMPVRQIGETELPELSASLAARLRAALVTRGLMDQGADG